MIENTRNHYVVARPVYSENAFSASYRKVSRLHKNTGDHLKECFGCSTKKVKRIVLNFLPVASWLPLYNFNKWFISDVISGISTGIVAVLQGLAFALLVNVSPAYGLYSAFYPVILYFFLGTSKHISVGPFPVLSLMIGSVVMRLVPDPVTNNITMAFDSLENNKTTIDGSNDLALTEQRILVAASVTVLAGIFQLTLGLMQFGFIVTYLSDPLISGFTTAAAVQVLVSQLKFILGLKISNFSGPLALFYTLKNIIQMISSTNIADLVTSVITMAVVFLVKEVNDQYSSKLPVPIPVELIVTIIVTGVSYVLDFNKIFNVQIIGVLERGYKAPITPSISIFQECLADGFAIAVVAFAVGFSVAKVYSIKHDYPINGNQELVALGLGNIVCGCFRGFAVSTALSRSAVQESTGGKSQIAGLLSALVVMIVTLAIGFLLEALPKSVLGAICLINLKGMLMQFNELPVLWKKDKYDCLVWMVTFIAAVILGLDLGLAAGVGFELLTLFEPEGIKIFRCPSPIFFANSNFFKDKLTSAVGFNPQRVLRKRNKALRKMRKSLNKGALCVSQKGVLCTSYGYVDTDDELDNSTVDELNNAANKGDLPFTIDWNLEHPNHFELPKVDLHTLILDFGAVSFIDVSGMNCLKTTLKEYIKIDVEVYIANIDSNLLDKLNQCDFFDDDIQSSILFLTIHDAVLHSLSRRGITYFQDHKAIEEKEFYMYRNGYMNGNIHNRQHADRHETEL